MARILHIDTGREMRGGQWQALRLMRGLASRGYQQALMASAPELVQNARDAGIEVIPLSLRDVARSSARFDLVHAHDARAHTLAAIASRRPLIVSRRVAFRIGRGPGSWWKYRRAARFLAVSEYVKRELLRAGVRAEKISVVYDGVEIPERAARGDLILAMRSGDPGKLNRRIEDAAKLAGAPVHFSDDLAADLRNAKLFIYLSESEGLGSAALLAMANGVPVIASRVGGLPEAVEDGETGLLVQNDAQGVAAAIRRLLDDPPLAARLGENGRRRAAERFTVERMVERTIAAYHIDAYQETARC